MVVQVLLQFEDEISLVTRSANDHPTQLQQKLERPWPGFREWYLPDLSLLRPDEQCWQRCIRKMIRPGYGIQLLGYEDHLEQLFEQPFWTIHFDTVIIREQHRLGLIPCRISNRYERVLDVVRMNDHGKARRHERGHANREQFLPGEVS